MGFIEFATTLFLFLCFDFLAARLPPSQGLNTHRCAGGEILPLDCPRSPPIIISNCAVYSAHACEFPKLRQVLGSNFTPFC